MEEGEDGRQHRREEGIGGNKIEKRVQMSRKEERGGERKEKMKGNERKEGG